MAVVKERGEFRGIRNALEGDLHCRVKPRRSLGAAGLIPLQRILVVLLGGWQK